MEVQLREESIKTLPSEKTGVVVVVVVILVDGRSDAGNGGSGDLVDVVVRGGDFGSTGNNG